VFFFFEREKAFIKMAQYETSKSSQLC